MFEDKTKETADKMVDRCHVQRRSTKWSWDWKICSYATRTVVPGKKYQAPNFWPYYRRNWPVGRVFWSVFSSVSHQNTWPLHQIRPWNTVLYGWDSPNESVKDEKTRLSWTSSWSGNLESSSHHLTATCCGHRCAESNSLDISHPRRRHIEERSSWIDYIYV